jgi:hypothetical protein
MLGFGLRIVLKKHYEVIMREIGILRFGLRTVLKIHYEDYYEKDWNIGFWIKDNFD